jgi:hypothetical protein
MRSHPTPNAPLSELSTALTSASAAADLSGDRRLKLLLHFLQLCMFGPIERFVLDAHAPHIVLADRHPVIDGAVYLPVLSQQLGASTPQADPNIVNSTDLARIISWAEAQTRRLGRSFDAVALATELCQLGTLEDADLLRELPNWLNCDLPDLVVQLAVPAEVAAERLTTRGGDHQLHENLKTLALIDARYDSLARQLGHLPFCRLQVADESPETAAALVRQAIDDVRDQQC